MRRIDWSFIQAREGRALRGYVPKNRKTGEVIGRSGVTVATGVDIGQRDRQGIVQLFIPDSLKRKLLPYTLLRGEKAVHALQAMPLALTEMEADALDVAIRNETIRELERRFNKATTKWKFENLPACVQTVLASLAYNFGPALDRKLPRTWKLAVEMKIPELAHALYHFPSKQPELQSRRKLEADLLAAFLKS